MNMEKINNKKREVYLDMLRIIACGFVIFNHCEGFELYKTSSSIFKPLYLLFSMLVSCAVPIFFMISGALLLKKQEDYKTVFKKRVKKIAFALLIAELLMYALNVFKAVIKKENYVIGVLDFIAKSLNLDMPGVVPYWFLFSYLGFLLMLPILQKLVKTIDKTDIKMIVFLRLLLEILIPLINYVLLRLNISSIKNEYFSVSIAMADNIFYPLIGYYLSVYYDSGSKRKETILITLTLFIIAMAFGLISNNINIFKAFLSCAIFVLVKDVSTYVSSERTKFLINKFASFTFGIYLIDPFLFSTIKTPIINHLNLIVSPFISSLIWVIISMMIGGIISMFIKYLFVIYRKERRVY